MPVLLDINQKDNITSFSEDKTILYFQKKQYKLTYNSEINENFLILNNKSLYKKLKDYTDTQILDLLHIPDNINNIDYKIFYEEDKEFNTQFIEDCIKDKIDNGKIRNSKKLKFDNYYVMVYINKCNFPIIEKDYKLNYLNKINIKEINDKKEEKRKFIENMKTEDMEEFLNEFDEIKEKYNEMKKYYPKIKKIYEKVE